MTNTIRESTGSLLERADGAANSAFMQNTEEVNTRRKMTRLCQLSEGVVINRSLSARFVLVALEMSLLRDEGRCSSDSRRQQAEDCAYGLIMRVALRGLTDPCLQSMWRRKGQSMDALSCLHCADREGEEGFE